MGPDPPSASPRPGPSSHGYNTRSQKGSSSVSDDSPASPPFRGFNLTELESQERTTIVPEDHPLDFTPLPTKKVKNKDLREKCAALGVSQLGVKKVLMDRIIQADPGVQGPSLPNNPDQSGTPEHFSFEKADVSLLKIPYGAKFQVAETFISLLNSVIAHNDIQSWNRLLAFGRVCLCQPLNSKENKKTSLSSLVKSQCRSFNDDELPTKRVLSDSQKKMSLAKRVDRKIQAFDTRGAVRLLSSNASFLPPSKETKDKLARKHPSPHPDTALPDPPQNNTPSFIVTKEDVRKRIRSFRSGSSAGADGLSPQHLKDISGESFVLGNKVCETLATFYNQIVFRGLIPDEVLEVYYGANLFGLSKPDGDVRPIAIGYTLRRLGGKLAMANMGEICQKVLRPRQVGVGVRRGAEAAVHAMRRIICDDDSEDLVALKVDMENAFNSVRRDKILQKVSQVAPALYPMTWQAYAKPTKLFYGDDFLLSQEGVQQGDVLGPLYFALAIQEMTDECKSDYSCWFLDDGVLVANALTIKDDYLRMVDSAAAVGLRLKPEKCEISSINPDNFNAVQSLKALEPLFKIVNVGDLHLLGAPLLPSSVEPVLQKKLEDLSRLCENLKLLEKHVAFYLLKNCFAIPRLLYFLRCAPCFTKPDLLKSYDLVIRESLLAIGDTPMDQRNWEIASLPVSYGGFGIRTASELAIPGFLSSAYGSTSVVNTLLPESTMKKDDPFIVAGVEEWKKLMDITEDGQEPGDKTVQENWDSPMCQKKFDTLLESGNCEEKSILLSSSSENASDWVHSVPITSLGLKLDNLSFKIVFGLRIGAKICSPYTCICGVKVNSFGRHGLSCQKAAGRLRRHNEANLIIKKSLASIDMPSTLEPKGLSATDGKQPDGLSYLSWKDGKNLIWDFTTSCNLAPSNISSSLKGPGKVAAEREQSKFTKYSNLMNNYFFTPIASETFGAWGPQSLSFLTDLGKELIAHTGEKRSKFFLFQKLGICIQRGNAASVLSSLPAGEKLDEVFQLC